VSAQPPKKGTSQNVSSNSTPKGTKKGQGKAPILAFDNRKRSTEACYSKSTKASPTRAAALKQGAPLQAKLSAVGFEGVKASQLHSIDVVQPYPLPARHGSFVGDEPPPYQLKAGIPYGNFDMEGIAPALVSHTQGSQIPLKGSKVKVSLVGGQSGSIVFNPPAASIGTEDMDASMHQSFINLIYPSKSKKLMSTESHHQKSKSLYVGGSHVPQSAVVKPVAQQMAPKGAIQKVNASSYKKQSSIFNYSQRFKELLSEEGCSPHLYQEAAATFERPHNVQSMQHARPPEVSNTIDYSNRLHNMPNATTQTLHQRKPSHPVTNNFMLDLLA